ncbi:hypothetical protein DSO57_1019131 [Entomophthora muscae]|uniref:Uncharacterized protein n=1 Tax=Entomophthora muscae TaxID=34485 RepID=A0ACC2RJ16_9FUNG|nr:hypothetical protein DSO57_1019131 [Entomophthora muscae]
MISLSVHSYLSLEKTRSHPLPLLLGLQVSHKIKGSSLPACPLSKCPPFVNKTSTLTLLSLNNTSKSPTVLVIIHGPLGKIKVLALLDTGADANFIEEKLAKLLGLPAFGSLDVKVGNSTLIGATPIL